ncbi:hypothetical protein HAX54_029139, partial [Datura stramonium]|nr:hypothetical protein [Datura stramonium]
MYRDQEPIHAPVARVVARDRGRGRGRDDQVHDKGVGPDQAATGFVATPVLQDTLVHMLNFLEGMTQSSVGQPAAIVAPRIGGMPLLRVASPLVVKTTMTIKEHKMFDCFKKMDPPTLRVDRYPRKVSMNEIPMVWDMVLKIIVKGLQFIEGIQTSSTHHIV